MASRFQQNLSRTKQRRLQTEQRRKTRRRCIRRGFYLLTVLALVAGCLYELCTSRLQAHYLARLAARCTVGVEPGESRAIRFPSTGPYDKRLGYVDLPTFIRRLTTEGYDISEQARFSPFLLEYTDSGFYPAYHEKSRAGLCITDHLGRPIFSATYPERTFSDFSSIPETVIEALLFIENKELLDPRYPMKNPAVEWKRLAAAALDYGLSFIDRDRNVPGGSTLATQMEKFRHSPNGQTNAPRDKLRQMVSAGVRAYLDGEETLQARYRIVLDFINSMPLGAIPGFGEISGLGDGLYAWYGADFDATMRHLSGRPIGPDDPALEDWAMALKQVVSLFVSQRRPSYFLLEDRQALETKTDSYLRMLAETGIITAWERNAALPMELKLHTSYPGPERGSFLNRKAVNTVRNNLLTLLDIDQLYRLNHLDLSVTSTIDQPVQQEVTTRLRQLNDPAMAEAAGLKGFRLLENSDPAKVIYSLTLYEHTEGANLLRLQTDTYDQPLNINSGTKLELGSSAKLRTLVTYLEIVAALHDRYGALTSSQLQNIKTAPADHLSHWALDYLSKSKDRELSTMLAAAMQREYSAGTKEQFFTGGGIHTFSNFDPKHDTGIFSVQEAFRNSINLVFIRLMRDIVQYYKFRIPGISELLSDVKNPERQEYLSKFADQEGTLFLQRFYRKYAGKSFDEAVNLLLQELGTNPGRMAAVFRYLKPDSDLHEFSAFLSAHIKNFVLPDDTIAELYDKYRPEAFSLVDRGYISRIHPLELWMIAYLHRHPDAGLGEALKASVEERQTVYTWLFKTSRKNKQDSRIRTLLEVEAFNEIHAAWKHLKYPFDSLVPSYATAIGSSADRPVALAELVGIILNGGRWYPSIRVQELSFAEKTPGEQVMRPEVASVVREALLGVVSGGTAQRAHDAFLMADGTSPALGGKTGTGDNRYDIYGEGGHLIHSRVVNRTAVFVFFLGDRFFGVITAYVDGPDAADYTFTSSLPVQVLKILAPELMHLISEKV